MSAKYLIEQILEEVPENGRYEIFAKLREDETIEGSGGIVLELPNGKPITFSVIVEGTEENPEFFFTNDCKEYSPVEESISIDEILKDNIKINLL